MDIDLSEYVAGGYFVVKYGRLRYAVDNELLPKQLVSLSSCISEKLDIMWGWNNSDRNQRQALDFGILQNMWQAFQEWSVNADADPLGIYKLKDARHAIKEFLLENPDVLLIGIGLHHELVDDFLTYRPYPDEHPNYLLFESVDSDNFRRNTLKDHFVNKREAIENSGHVLGFEVISFFGSWSHSWLCSGLEKDMHELYGIRPNGYGLIDRYAEAKKVYEWIAEDEMQGTRAEPEPYYPWLLVQYPVEERS